MSVTATQNERKKLSLAEAQSSQRKTFIIFCRSGTARHRAANKHSALVYRRAMPALHKRPFSASSAPLREKQVFL